MAKIIALKVFLFVVISPNDPKAVRLDEMGWTDMGDSFEEMKLRAKHKKYIFLISMMEKHRLLPGPMERSLLPHVFIFDKERKLRYQGRVDDVEKPTKTPNNFDTRNALDEMLAGKDVTVKTTRYSVVL